MASFSIKIAAWIVSSRLFLPIRTLSYLLGEASGDLWSAIDHRAQGTGRGEVADKVLTPMATTGDGHAGFLLGWHQWLFTPSLLTWVTIGSGVILPFLDGN